jgi:hypothetical protein
LPFDRRAAALVASKEATLSITVDAVWPRDDEQPTVTGFVSFLTAPEPAIVPRPTPTYTFDEDDLVE